MVRFSGVDSKAKLSPSSMRDIEATLKIVDPNFVPFEKPTAITATTTTSPIRSKSSHYALQYFDFVEHLTSTPLPTFVRACVCPIHKDTHTIQKHNSMPY